MRDLRNTLEQAGIGLSKFAGSYLNAQNKSQPCYHLPRRECDLDGLPTRWFSLPAGVSASVRILNPEATNPGAEHHQI